MDDGQCLLLALGCSAFVVASPFPQYLLSRRIPVFLGKISFGVYLVHVPIICALAFPIYDTMIRYGSTAVASLISLLGLGLVSLLGGWIFWRIVDCPTIALANTLAKTMNPSPVAQEEEPWKVLRRVA
jgi:peptidoglycan/LPS O-acetylase OafA/YrhL